jgi:uncharacterized membrane protein
MGTLSVLIAAIQVRFLLLPLPQASPDMLHHVADIAPVFWLHVVAAAVAMAVGVPQFSVRLRATYPRFHRWTGRTYVAAVAVGGLSGFGLAMNANGGFVTQSGFALLAVCWLAATGIALRHVLAGRYAVHRQWMIRSYALTFAAVTLRLQVPIWVNLLGTDYTGVLPIIAWSCWVPNLIVAEWLIGRRPQPPATERVAAA